MALIFGSGEPVSRLRRSLDLKGKVNLSVDEIIVPVITTFDATKPPFRRTGIRWHIVAVIPAVIGELGRVRIFHQLPVDQLIDRVIIASGDPDDFFVNIGAGPSGAAAGLFARTTEIMRVDSGGVISRQIPIQHVIDSVTPTSLSQTFATVFQQFAGTLDLPLEIVLPAQADPTDPVTNAPTLTVEAASNQVAFTVTVSGLYWDSLPLNALT